MQSVCQACADPRIAEKRTHIDRDHLVFAVRSAHAKGQPDRFPIRPDRSDIEHLAVRRRGHHFSENRIGKRGKTRNFAGVQYRDFDAGRGHAGQPGIGEEMSIRS